MAYRSGRARGFHPGSAIEQLCKMTGCDPTQVRLLLHDVGREASQARSVERRALVDSWYEPSDEAAKPGIDGLVKYFCTGQRMSDNAWTMCAVVDAFSIEQAKGIVMRAWPSKKPDKEWRLSTPRQRTGSPTRTGSANEGQARRGHERREELGKVPPGQVRLRSGSTPRPSTGVRSSRAAAGTATRSSCSTFRPARAHCFVSGRCPGSPRIPWPLSQRSHAGYRDRIERCPRPGCRGP